MAEGTQAAVWPDVLRPVSKLSTLGSYVGCSLRVLLHGGAWLISPTEMETVQGARRAEAWGVLISALPVPFTDNCGFSN
jgi:hypothetical protein